MEPTTLIAGAVAAYAQTVSLIADYKSVRGQRDTSELKDFLEWLTTTGHHEMRSLLERNQATSVGIKAILGEHTQTVLVRLGEIDARLAILSQGIEGFGDLATAFHPASRLSRQQLGLLQAFEIAKAGEGSLHYDGEKHYFVFFDGDSPGYPIDEPRFLKDDLEILVSSGLLHRFHDHRYREPFYHFTRSAKELLDRLNAQDSMPGMSA